MKLIDGNLVKTAIEFAKQNFNTDLDEKEVSDIVRNLSFSDNMNLADALKNDDGNLFSEFFNLAEIEEATTPYGAQNAQQRAMNTKQNNANRRANNAQQDQQRDSTGGRPAGVPGNRNQRATGQGAARYDKRADPDDVERRNNSGNIDANAGGIDANRQEIERLKQLVYRR